MNDKRIHAQKSQMSLGIRNIDIVACSHTGLTQKINEDRYLVKTMDDGALLLAVADGLGGGVSSDIAAEMTKGKLASLTSLSEGREVEGLETIAKNLDLFIHEKAEENPSLAYMATTLVCTVLKNDMIHWLNVGDSRFYLFRDGTVNQITEDQTMAKILVEEGELKPEDASGHYSRKILDQCLGYGACEPETGSFQVKQGDTIILATDGLYKMIKQGMMINILISDQSLKQKIKALTDAALSSGGKDNITIVLAHIKQTL